MAGSNLLQQMALPLPLQQPAQALQRLSVLQGKLSQPEELLVQPATEQGEAAHEQAAAQARDLIRRTGALLQSSQLGNGVDQDLQLVHAPEQNKLWASSLLVLESSIGKKRCHSGRKRMVSMRRCQCSPLIMLLRQA